MGNRGQKEPVFLDEPHKRLTSLAKSLKTALANSTPKILQIPPEKAPKEIQDIVLKFLSGCDDAMIGRAAYGNPWIIGRGLSLLREEIAREPSLEEKERVLLRHLSLIGEWKGETNGLREFRKHLIWYIRGFRGSMEFRTRIPQWEILWLSALNLPAFSQKNRSFPNFFPIFLDNHFHSR